MGINLTKPQGEIFTCESRFRVVVAGRRFGKSYLSAVELLKKAADQKEALCYYIAPTYRLAKSVMWTAMKKIVPENFVSKINESELSITLINLSIIRLVGSDDPQKLRGVSLSFCVIDEFAFCKEEMWWEAIRPALSDQKGGALFITTPYGMNWAYDLYNSASSLDQWRSFQYTTIEGGQVDQEEIDLAKSQMTARQYAQEYLASFENIGNRVYYAFNRDNHHAQCPIESCQIHIGMDFNVNPMSAVVAVKAGDQLYVIDEIMLENSNTQEMCATLSQKYKGFSVVVYPDPSGAARKTSASGSTDFSIIKEYGFKIDAPKKAPAVIDRLENVNRLLCNSNNETKLFISKKCTYLTKCLEGLTYKKGGERIQDKTLGLDHATDALGYLCWQLMPLRSKSLVTSIEMF